jgi:hypothetical protein
MPRFRSFGFLLPPILAASLLVLTGALAQQTTPPSQPAKAAGPAPKEDSKPASTSKSDPNALKLLETAISSLDARKLGWVAARIWIKVDAIGLNFQSEGRYLSGPNYRLRLDLNLSVGASKSASTVVSDGQTVWNSMRVGADAPAISRYDLKAVRDLLNSPGTQPQFSEDFYKSQYFLGLAPLLQNLRQTMVLTKMENELWQGHPVVKVSASWTPEISKGLTAAMPPGSSLWPPFTARTSVLFLDRNAPHWPYRLEWWGPAGGTTDKVLMQMEFRDPKIVKGSEPMPGSFAQAFTFNPGQAEVVDQSKDITERLTAARTRPIGPASRSPLGTSPAGQP